MDVQAAAGQLGSTTRRIMKRVTDILRTAGEDVDVETYRLKGDPDRIIFTGRTLSAARGEARTETRQLCVILTDDWKTPVRNNVRAGVRHDSTSQHQGWTFRYREPTRRWARR